MYERKVKKLLAGCCKLPIQKIEEKKIFVYQFELELKKLSRSVGFNARLWKDLMDFMHFQN